MTLADARPAILAALGRMNAAYTAPVFDEWVLVAFKPERGTLLAYEGPRPDTYKQRFPGDLAAMRQELAGQKLGIGDFAFATAAAGTQYDACLRLGDSSYLFLNDTTRTMGDIRQNPRWRDAQVHFAALSEKFRNDPLV